MDNEKQIIIMPADFFCLPARDIFLGKDKSYELYIHLHQKVKRECDTIISHAKAMYQCQDNWSYLLYELDNFDSSKLETTWKYDNARVIVSNHGLNNTPHIRVVP